MKKLLATVAGSALLLGLGAGVANAKDGDIVKTGACSGTSQFKLKVAPRPGDGVNEVEFEVDSNVVGQTWRVRLLDNGVVVSRGTRTTLAPSGSFTYRARLADTAGANKIVARATNPATGEVCRSSATV